MSLSPVQAAHRAAHRARLELDARRAAAATASVQKLLEQRDQARETLSTMRTAITVMEDEAFAQFIHVIHVQRRLCELGYTGE